MFLILITLSLSFFQSCVSNEDASKILNGAAAEASGQSFLSFGVTSISPNRIHKSGGELITVKGAQFDSTTLVLIDGSTPCQNITVFNATTLTCTAPAKAVGNYDVSVEKGTEVFDLSNALTYMDDLSLLDAGLVSDINITEGPALLSSSIQILGTNIPKDISVQFITKAGAHSCSSVNVNDNGNIITCSTPNYNVADAVLILTPADIRVTTLNNKQSQTLNSAFTFIAPPNISSITYSNSNVSAPPVDGNLTTNVTQGSSFNIFINGHYFDQGNSVVKINGTLASGCNATTATLITCSSLPDLSALNIGSGAYTISVTNLDGQTGTYNQFFTLRPTITGTSPTTLATAGATTLTLNATDHGTPQSIEFRNMSNSSALGTCTLGTSNPLTCSSPAATTQNAIIRLTNQWGYFIDYSHVVIEDPVELQITGDDLVNDKVSFRRVTLGTTRSTVFTVRNIALGVDATDFTVDSTGLTGTGFQVDNLGGSQCTSTVAASSVCSIGVSYTPTQLEYAQDDSSSPYIDISYNNGITVINKRITFYDTWSVPLDILMDQEKSFGDVSYGVNHTGDAPSFEHVVFVENRGTADVSLDMGAPFFTSGANTVSGEFHFYGAGAHPDLGSFPGNTIGANITSKLCPGSGVIPALTRCAMVISFRPQTSGAKSAILSLSYSGGAFSKSITLNGNSSSQTNTLCNPAQPNIGGGSGTSAADPFLICAPEHLEHIATQTAANGTVDGTAVNSRSAFYLQTQDIDLTSSSFTQIIHPGGNASFDGGNYKVYNLSSAGFFDSWSSGSLDYTIKNMHFRNYNYTNSAVVYSGALASRFYRATANIYIENCSAQGSNDSPYSGGLIGYGYNVNFNNVYTAVNVSSTNVYNGGIIGVYNHNSPTSLNKIYTYSDISGTHQLGGIAGILYANTSIDFTRNYSSSSISTTSGYSGGLLGQVSVGANGNFDIDQSGFYGKIWGTGSWIGGITGYISSAAAVTPSVIRRSFVKPSHLIDLTNEIIINTNGQFAGLLTGYTIGTGTVLTVQQNYTTGSVNSGPYQSSLVTNCPSSNCLIEDNMVLGEPAAYAAYSGLISSITKGRVRRTYSAAFPFKQTSDTIHMKEVFWRDDGTTFNSTFYLQGIGGGHQDATSGISSITQTVLTAQDLIVLGLNNGADNNWKRIPHFPYPVLNWMPADWMP